jgi:hypothetical protein
MSKLLEGQWVSTPRYASDYDLDVDLLLAPSLFSITLQGSSEEEAEGE